MQASEGKVTDDLLQGRSLSRFQISVFLLCGLVGLLDGYDTQVTAVSAASIASSLHVQPATMSFAIAAGLAGTAIGAVSGGQLADRIGRRLVLICASVLFGLFDLITPWVDSVAMMGGVRFVAGLGLGAAAPVFVALASGYAPPERRGFFTSLVWSSFPIGITGGALLNGYLLGIGSWETLYYLGGGGALVAALILAAYLPDSLEFLALATSRHAEFARVLSRVAPGPVIMPVIASSRLVRGSVRSLFIDLYARPTLLIWATLFCCFGTTSVSINYVPLILRQNGISPSAAAYAVSVHGLGALVGMLAAGRFVDRFGPLALVPPLLMGAAAAALQGLAPDSAAITSVFFGLVGMFVGMAASGTIALATMIYPEALRGTGVGWGLGSARLGQVVLPASFGAMLVHAWPVQTSFACLAIVPILALACVTTLARHRREGNDLAREPIGRRRLVKANHAPDAGSAETPLGLP